MIELFSGYLRNLNNGNHFGVVGQIITQLDAYDTDNPAYLATRQKLKDLYKEEDEAYNRSQKDWTVEKLKKADELMDSYMIGIRSILAGHASMPESEPLVQPAKEFLQLWKDFNFKTSDSYASESSKIINMYQEVKKRLPEAEKLGIDLYFKKATDLAVQIQDLLSQRFKELSSRTVGELKNAREASDNAIKEAYLIVQSMQILLPSEEITALAKKLKTVEDYAKKYYMKDTGENASADNTEAEKTTVSPATAPAEEPLDSAALIEE